MTAMFKQHQVTPSLASVKAVDESCVTCGSAHSYRQCPAIDGNTFSGYHDNIQGYVSAATVNYSQGNTRYCPPSVANQTRPPDVTQPYEQKNQNRTTSSSPSLTTSEISDYSLEEFADELALIESLIWTDIANITRKEPKPGKNEHETDKVHKIQKFSSKWTTKVNNGQTLSTTKRQNP
ncbi:hypothetical protein Tco_0833439 [Tanacetum coccineum]